MKAVTELLQLMEKVLMTVSGVVSNNVSVKKKTDEPQSVLRSVLFRFPKILIFALEGPVIR